VPASIRAAKDARRAKGATSSPRAPHQPRMGRARPCSLLRPTGPSRRVAVARAELDAVRTVAHQHGATVNDLLLTAIGGALHVRLD
jgi:diacylglycerol O-acyltransferase